MKSLKLLATMLKKYYSLTIFLIFKFFHGINKLMHNSRYYMRNVCAVHFLIFEVNGLISVIVYEYRLHAPGDRRAPDRKPDPRTAGNRFPVSRAGDFRAPWIRP